jgi:predicted extracellular nuclease
VNSGPGTPLATTNVAMPVTAQSDWEKYEGMLVAFEQDLYISEYFNFDRFGEIVITTARQYQPSQVFEPGSADAFALATANALARITLDDGRTAGNPDPAIHPNGWSSPSPTRSGGDILQDVTGVLAQAFGLYRIHPTQGATYIVANPRPTTPDLGQGHLRVASFNVLNFFTHLDLGPDVCGPTGLFECRGADTLAEYERQLAKLVAGIVALDADIVGLEEIENDIHDDDGNRAHDAAHPGGGAERGRGAGTWAWVGEATARRCHRLQRLPGAQRDHLPGGECHPGGARWHCATLPLTTFRPAPSGGGRRWHRPSPRRGRSDRANAGVHGRGQPLQVEGVSCGAADPVDPHQAECN